jgi:hypothetical protein
MERSDIKSNPIKSNLRAQWRSAKPTVAREILKNRMRCSTGLDSISKYRAQNGAVSEYRAMSAAAALSDTSTRVLLMRCTLLVFVCTVKKKWCTASSANCSSKALFVGTAASWPARGVLHHWVCKLVVVQSFLVSVRKKKQKD